jgi:YD repeat-containing protein
MPNTYTPNYNLAKPAAGDINWDDEINGNFDILDSTIKLLETLLSQHMSDTNNPHQVTHSQVGAAPASHIHSGAEIFGQVAQAANADRVDGYDASDFFLLGNTNQSINFFRALNQQIDTRNLVLVYDTSGKLTTVYEKDGGTTVKTTTLGYDSNGNLSTVTEQVGGRTITTTLSYDTNGNLGGITRQVS